MTMTIILLIWSSLMLITYLKTFPNAYGESGKENFSREIAEIREDRDAVLFVRIVVTIRTLYLACFWFTMVSVFTNTALILYCILYIILLLGSLKGSYEIIEGKREMKSSVLSKILKPINVLVILYFIISLLECL